MGPRKGGPPPSLATGYEVIEVPSNGDCFFSAVIASAGLPDDVPLLRKKAYDMCMQIMTSDAADEDLRIAATYGDPKVCLHSFLTEAAVRACCGYLLRWAPLTVACNY